MKTLSSDKRVSRLAADAVLLGAALLFTFVEAILPVGLIPLPGFKLGLANLAVTAAAYRCSIGDAATVSAARILITFLLFGNPVSLLFSLAGGLLVLLVLSVLTRPTVAPRFSFWGVSLCSAAAHNLGQLAAATALFGSAVLSYAPVLAAAALLCGTLTGWIMNLLPESLWRINGLTSERSTL